MFGVDSQSEGDTQPVSQSVYNEFASRRTGQLAARDESKNHEHPNLEDSAISGSLHGGETGHIDIVGVFEQPSNIDNDRSDAEVEDDDTDPLSQAVHIRADPFPESKRFKQPKTPANNGKKRKRGTQSQEDAITPGLPVNPFAGGTGDMDGKMGPSQMFEATQAPTSPLANLVPSDGLSERPSPDVHVLQHPSRAGPLSSPANASRFRTVRAVTEPQTTYISMKESQEARERHLQSLKVAQSLSADPLSDDDFGSADTQILRRTKQRRIDAEAKSQFAGLTARVSPVNRDHGRSQAGRTKGMPGKNGTRQAGRKASEPVLISDDAPLEDTQGTGTEDETEREEEIQPETYDDVDELAEEENKENVEVPRTISSVHHTTPQVITSQATPSHQITRTAKRGGCQIDRVVQVEGSSQNTRSQEPVKAVEGATQPDAIADSQVSQGHAKSEQTFRAKDDIAVPGPQSSLDSRVLVAQSQSAPIRVQYESTETFPNLVPSPRNTPKSTSKAASNPSITEQSRPSTLFETAQEYLTGSPSNLRPQRVQKASPVKKTSPTKKRLSRTISEIAADPSPPDLVGDVDVDIDILSNDDIEFQNAIRSPSPIGPARKRRRGGQGLALQVAYQEPNKLPPPARSPLSRSFNSDPPGSSAISPITPHPASEGDRPSWAITKSVTIKQALSKGSDTSERKDVAAAKPPAMPRAASVSNNPDSAFEPEAANKNQTAAATDTDAPAQQPALQTSDTSTDQPPSNVRIMTAPNRVFAHFNGTNPAYHPATCLEMVGGGDARYRVRFEDGTIDIISGYGIKRLDLRPGDVVKVDLPGARKLNYVVEGVRDQHMSTIARDPATPSRRGRTAPIYDSAFPEVDVYGNATVLVSPKQRQSVGGDQPENSQIAVPLTLVYLTQMMWTAFKDRHYSHISTTPQTMTGLQTPSERPSTPSTPSSRTRRVRSSGLAHTYPTTIGNVTGDAIFRKMAFAITNIDRADENERIKNHINSNGGKILTTGLDELFHVPTLPRTTSPIDPNADTSFHLTPAAKDLGFTCLIADRHCRTAKYIQALSLGIPCLSTRWITHCVAKQRVLPWAPYLLPSGESAFLGGAIRSRVLQPFDAETATLSDLVDRRSKMLDKASVLIIMGKDQEKSMQQHPLITHALGASKISRAISNASAAKAVADAQALGEQWDWVFSYDKAQEVEDILFGASGTSKKRKRGRDSESGSTSKRGKTRVVGNEFVIQSLILGMLIEE